MKVGATNVPCRVSSGSGAASTFRPSAAISCTCWSMIRRASSLITGPTSVARRSGLPTFSSRTAPFNIARVRSAISSWRQRTRNAEHRCPALSNADEMTSATTCSASADESTTIAFWPPVSAISGMGWPFDDNRSDNWRWMSRATSVEPVNITPQVPGFPTSAAPTSPAPGSN